MMPNRPESIDRLLDRVGTLPSMPRVAQKALEIIRDPASNMSDLANVIKLDQAMSGLILRWVNSGYYGLRHRVISIEQAVNFIGQRSVQELVLGASAASFMVAPLPGYSLEKGDLWKHSLGVAAGARLLMSKVNPAMQDDAYYAGLFADVGKLAFDVLLRSVEVDLSDLSDWPFYKVERVLFGYDHPTVGAAMVRRWNLPEYIASVIQNHHSPAKVEENWRPLAYAVHAADCAMMMFGIGLGSDALSYDLDPELVNVLDWNDDSLDELYVRVVPLLQQTDLYLG